MKKVHSWLAQAGEIWKPTATGLKEGESKVIILSLTVFPLFIHSHYMVDFSEVTGKGYCRVVMHFLLSLTLRSEHCYHSEHRMGPRGIQRGEHYWGWS